MNLNLQLCHTRFFFVQSVFFTLFTVATCSAQDDRADALLSKSEESFFLSQKLEDVILKDDLQKLSNWIKQGKQFAHLKNYHPISIQFIIQTPDISGNAHDVGAVGDSKVNGIGKTVDNSRSAIARSLSNGGGGFRSRVRNTKLQTTFGYSCFNTDTGSTPKVIVTGILASVRDGEVESIEVATRRFERVQEKWVELIPNKNKVSSKNKIKE